ncbi:hypothetical protein GOP47_0016206 [Adiantum capillus-veneris]|uniref:Uncharacterized protein n=1 Tax=Adiantum capillus-veneris TaxID=13818 RepID=A0A9D4UIC0_ADICA|nr:hypothetical protein GOP47_0016206 [Adiantum capillus-veneris]
MQYFSSLSARASLLFGIQICIMVTHAVDFPHGVHSTPASEQLTWLNDSAQLPNCRSRGLSFLQQASY